MTPESIFNQRIQQFQQAEQAAQNRHNQLAFWRLVWFVGTAITLWGLIQANQQLAAAAILLIGVIGFMVLLKKHQAIKRERDLNHHLAVVNQDEAGRLKRQYLRTETGEKFSSPTHFYAGDLDVFGKHSLFRLLNRTHTHSGQQHLANWLLAPSDPAIVRSRQQAAAELNPQIEWRQQIEALAHLEGSINRPPDALFAWAAAPAAPLPAYLNVVRFLFPLITLLLFIAWLTGYVPGIAVLLSLAVHALILRTIASQAALVSNQTYTISSALKGFRVLFQQAEQLTGTSPKIQAIRNTLVTNSQPISGIIGQLAKLTEGLNYRQNPYFYLFFGVFSLWDMHYLIRLERWRQEHGPKLEQWFTVLGELEALNSLAGFSYAHPTYVTPDLTTTEFALDFTAAAHPLLIPGHSVANSLSLEGSGQTVLITGSNMSGKSTFLRTVGANVVLAFAGAVVSAERFTCSPVQVFTSMRTQDSLEESTSSFYAELKRLQTLIGLSQQLGALPVLYFLDEILKGTNSADRHRGAEALIRQLHQTTASGFVSTHDLELGQLGDSSGFVHNYHFQSDLKQGELIFDYYLRSGICESFNASQLMRAIGINIDAVQS
ncbi:MutS-related protein [Spirosoma sp. KUDC1026]|uniref:MutS-related protein n=1 Tax=Spirosoma sp. KUDC1026 TaxID=2745947 RepID=UPI00159BB170|nr:DNA mismatch repair protein MutS [Spirosoma sp. KUDC1026]QKZ11634.1 DNA mismatch repair protein MutS [Spirosoma sp. KUDC1026]